MGFRNIKIDSHVKLQIKNQQLLIDAGEEIQIPLEDINCILIENQTVTLSAYLLQKLADMGIALYVCDEKHLPNAVLLPMVRHSRHFKILKYQMEAAKPLQKRLWQQIVIQKIKNQALCLELLGREGAKELFAMCREVQSGDRTHVEAKAAAFYFKSMYGIGFSRGNEHIINSALNYGYAIVRGLIARSIVCYGLEPSIGVFHCSELNSYNLADDLIEPFRPLVDLYVSQHYDISEIDSVLTPEAKRGIFGIINFDMDVKGEKRIISNCVDMLAASYSSALQERRTDLDLPELIQLQVHRYE
uniref:type II CRISPR-associated endonuclease Cas1 n=1 Tax=Roseburia sp. TaxID=2049040 RepID=UPI003FF11968